VTEVQGYKQLTQCCYEAAIRAGIEPTYILRVVTASEITTLWRDRNVYLAIFVYTTSSKDTVVKNNKQNRLEWLHWSCLQLEKGSWTGIIIVITIIIIVVIIIIVTHHSSEKPVCVGLVGVTVVRKRYCRKRYIYWHRWRQLAMCFRLSCRPHLPVASSWLQALWIVHKRPAIVQRVAPAAGGNSGGYSRLRCRLIVAKCDDARCAPACSYPSLFTYKNRGRSDDVGRRHTDQYDHCDAMTQLLLNVTLCALSSVDWPLILLRVALLEFVPKVLYCGR